MCCIPLHVFTKWPLSPVSPLVFILALKKTRLEILIAICEPQGRQRDRRPTFVKKFLENLSVKDHIRPDTKIPGKPPDIVATSMEHFHYSFVFKDMCANHRPDIFLCKVEGVDQVCCIRVWLAVIYWNLYEAKKTVVCMLFGMLHVYSNPLFLTHVLHCFDEIGLIWYMDYLAFAIKLLQRCFLQ